jgi:hypothetical protein
MSESGERFVATLAARDARLVALLRAHRATYGAVLPNVFLAELTGWLEEQVASAPHVTPPVRAVLAELDAGLAEPELEGLILRSFVCRVDAASPLLAVLGPAGTHARELLLLRRARLR